MKNKIRVFLVDDNNFDNYYHRKIIEKFNSDIEVQIFDSAEDALLYLNIIPINNFPNYIFLDINLPGFNGWDFLKNSFDMMITEKPDCKIIMLTTSENTDDKQKAEKTGIIFKYIIKPLNQPKLLDVIQSTG